MVLGLTSLWLNAAVFLFAAGVIGVVGPRLSRAADHVGQVTGLGQTLAGALLLGASTSLPGLIVSLFSAYQGRATLAVANSVGGIAAQTMFIALADIALRSDTLEHRDTLTASLMQSAVLASLLTLLLIAMLRPDLALYGGFHPVSIFVVAGVVLGFWTIQETRKHPSWRVRRDDGDDSRDGTRAGSSTIENSGRRHRADGPRSGPDEQVRGESDADERSDGRERDDGEDARPRSVSETRVITVTDRILTLPFRERVYTERTIESTTDERDSGVQYSRGDDHNDEGERSAAPRQPSDQPKQDKDRRTAQRQDSRSESQSGSGDASQSDSGEMEGSSSKAVLYKRYGLYVSLVAVAGYLISSAAGAIIVQTGFSPIVMGLTLTAVATSLPELVTAIASVRRGAVALAIGDIVGGNAFDTIMVALADFAYVEGSIYAAVTPTVPFITAVALLMTGVLAVGFVRRDHKGLANIGVESYLILLVYLTAILTVLLGTVLPSPL